MMLMSICAGPKPETTFSRQAVPAVACGKLELKDRDTATGAHYLPKQDTTEAHSSSSCHKNHVPDKAERPCPGLANSAEHIPPKAAGYLCRTPSKVLKPIKSSSPHSALTRYTLLDVLTRLEPLLKVRANASKALPCACQC